MKLENSQACLFTTTKIYLNDLTSPRPALLPPLPIVDVRPQNISRVSSSQASDLQLQGGP